MSPVVGSIIPVNTINRMALMGLFSTTAAIISQSWSKTSFAMTLLCISDGWRHKFLWVVIVMMNVLFGLGSLFFWISCTPLEKAWHPLTKGTCWDTRFTIIFGIVISAFAGIMDLIFVVIPWTILMPTRLNPKEKFGCAVAMSMGVL
ncbi:hypothetical protein GQ53DRAFT_641198 [Thozetella sp. PMI_491]|nr:hypothetical protein GQ53DRAFT_641198 [Thozetella sp. PMI_491]